MSQAEPTVAVDALETFVELLAGADVDGQTDDFYSRLCEATCRVASMDRAIIFRYDDARRRVHAAGSYGIELDLFENAHLTVESAPIARQSLEEDRVIEVRDDDTPEVPEEYRDLLREATLVCTPMSAAGRWLGVILSDRGAGRAPLTRQRAPGAVGARQDGGARHARAARHQPARAGADAAGADRPRARRARGRDPAAVRRAARVLQPGRAVAPRRASGSRPSCRRRCSTCGARSSGRSAAWRRRRTPRCWRRSARLRREHPDLQIQLTRGSERVQVPRQVEPLAQSVLAEAVRNAHKHARPSRVEVTLDRSDGTLTLEVANDGVSGRPKSTGMGLRLAALEALQVGGIVEFGEREPGTWRVRLAVPDDRA